MSAILKTVAVSLIKIANDIRWLGSGPRCGIGELLIPETQPGSSIMPGKVNPVIPESLIQVCCQVIGNDAAVTLGGLSGNFELNVMMPLIAYNLLQSIRLLANAVDSFSRRCVQGLEADRKRCEEMIEKSLALATALTPRLGYDEAARIARKAYEEKKTIRQAVEEEGLLSREDLNRLLDPLTMLAPASPKQKKKRDEGRMAGSGALLFLLNHPERCLNRLLRIFRFDNGGTDQSGPVDRPGTEADDRHSKLTGQSNLGEGSEHPAYGNEDPAGSGDNHVSRVPQAGDNRDGSRGRKTEKNCLTRL